MVEAYRLLDQPDELDEVARLDQFTRMSTSAPGTAATKRPSAPARGRGRQRLSHVVVPNGMSPEEARRILAAVAGSAGAVLRTGRSVSLKLKPTSGRGQTRFMLVKSPEVVPVPPAAAVEDSEPLSAAAARAALKRAYARGAAAASDILSGPDMLNSDSMAKMLGLSREAVLQKRRRGELLGLEGAKRGVRFPSWQIGEGGRPAAILPDLLKALGEPWAVFRFLQQRHPELGGRTGIEAATKPRLAAALLALAQRGEGYGPSGG